MLELKECNRNNLCVDCNDKNCLHRGQIESDCPKYHCDNNNIFDCNNCNFMKEYQMQMRKYYKEDINGGDTIDN